MGLISLVQPRSLREGENSLHKVVFWPPHARHGTHAVHPMRTSYQNSSKAPCSGTSVVGIALCAVAHMWRTHVVYTCGVHMWRAWEIPTLHLEGALTVYALPMDESRFLSLHNLHSVCCLRGSLQMLPLQRNHPPKARRKLVQHDLVRQCWFKPVQSDTGRFVFDIFNHIYELE